MITGSCHCKSIEFEITSEITGFKHCHCQSCRKIHGTVYGSSALVEKAGFNLIKGESDLTRYESTPGKKRCFCKNCGSHVFAYFDSDPETIVLRMGLLDKMPDIKLEAHIWLADKPDWYDIDRSVHCKEAE